MPIKHFKKGIAVFLIFFSLLSFSAPVLAADPVVPPGAGDASQPNVNDLLGLAVRISDIILGIVGSLALLYFIYGGFKFLLGGASEENIKSGKQILINAVIGLIVVFTSYLIIGFVMASLGVPEAKQKGFWATTGWFEKNKK